MAICKLFQERKFDENNQPIMKNHEKFIYDVRMDRIRLMGSKGLIEYDKRRETIIIRFCDGKFHYKTNGINPETVTGKCPILTGKAIEEKVEIVKQETKRVMTFDNFEGKSETIDFIKGFMGNFQVNTIVLFGYVGTGKSHLARSLQINEIEKGKTAEFIMAEDLNKLFLEYESWNDDKIGKWSAKKKYNSMINADLLIIDDLGTEKLSKTDHFSTQLLILLEKMKGKLLITTNLKIEYPDMFHKLNNKNGYLNSRYNDRIISRILEKARKITLTGRDYRRLKK